MLGFGKKKDLRPEHPNFDATKVSKSTVVVRDGAYINAIDGFTNGEGHQCYSHEIFDRNGGYLGSYIHDTVGETTIMNTSDRYSNGSKDFNVAHFAKEGGIYQRSEMLQAGTYYDTTEIGQSVHMLQRDDGFAFKLDTFDGNSVNYIKNIAQEPNKQTDKEIPSYMKGNIAKFMNEPSNDMPEGTNKDGLDF